MALFQKNVRYNPPARMSAWRKIAVGTWRDAKDPSVYGMIELDAEPALRHIDKLQRQSGKKVTITHFLTRALAETIFRHPSINCVLRFGKLYPRQTVDIFVHVAADKAGQELSGLKVAAAHQKTVLDIAEEIDIRARKVREEGDPEYRKMKSTLNMIPSWLSWLSLDFTSLLTYTFNIWTPLLGVPRDAFGSAMLTNIGSLGLEIGFVPLVPYSKCPLLISVATIAEKPVVVDGQIVIKKMLPICATFDHRLIDGVHASHMVRTLKQIFANPEIELKEGH